MKTQTLLVTALIVSFGALSSCGGSSSGKQKPKDDILTPGDKSSPVEPTPDPGKNSFEDLAKQIEAMKNSPAEKLKTLLRSLTSSSTAASFDCDVTTKTYDVFDFHRRFQASLKQARTGNDAILKDEIRATNNEQRQIVDKWRAEYSELKKKGDDIQARLTAAKSEEERETIRKEYSAEFILKLAGAESEMNRAEKALTATETFLSELWIHWDAPGASSSDIKVTVKPSRASTNTYFFEIESRVSDCRVSETFEIQSAEINAGRSEVVLGLKGVSTKSTCQDLGYTGSHERSIVEKNFAAKLSVVSGKNANELNIQRVEFNGPDSHTAAWCGTKQAAKLVIAGLSR